MGSSWPALVGVTVGDGIGEMNAVGAALAAIAAPAVPSTATRTSAVITGVFMWPIYEPAVKGAVRDYPRNVEEVKIQIRVIRAGGAPRHD